MRKLTPLLLFIAFSAANCGDGVQTNNSSNKSVLSNTEISFWVYLDGSDIAGLNYDLTKTADTPKWIEWNAKLYGLWVESNGTARQLRAAVLSSGKDTSKPLTFIDGNGKFGLNKNPNANASDPSLAVFNSKLYATWSEGNPAQTRVAVYNGNNTHPSWALVDGNGPTGINKDPAQAASAPTLAATDTRLYAAWVEGTSGKVRVAEYNGNDLYPAWNFIDGNDNPIINPIAAARSAQLTVFNFKPYVLWVEDSGFKRLRVSAYGGNYQGIATWKTLDNGQGINKNLNQDALNPKTAIFNSKLHVTWEEAGSIRVATFGGSEDLPTWNFLGDAGQATASMPSLAVSKSKLYATWLETNPRGDKRVRVAVLTAQNGTPKWNMIAGNEGNVQGDLNKYPTSQASSPHLAVFNSELYSSWSELSDGSSASLIHLALGL